MNMIDWMRATAKWMHADRPDLYIDEEAALATLYQWVEQVRTVSNFANGIETGGFLLSHSNEDGVEEWTLSKLVSSCIVFEDEEECLVYGWTKGSGTMNVDVDLPDVTEGLDIDLDI